MSRISQRPNRSLRYKQTAINNCYKQTAINKPLKERQKLLPDTRNEGYQETASAAFCTGQLVSV